MAGKLRGSKTKEELNDKIEAFAYAMVNITHGVRKDAYIYALQAIGIPEEDRTKNPARQASEFYIRHKEKIEAKMEEFRQQNQQVLPHMRDSNIAVLREIIATAKNNNDKIRAIQVLNQMFGYDSKTVNIKSEDVIVVDLVE